MQKVESSFECECRVNFDWNCFIVLILFISSLLNYILAICRFTYYTINKQLNYDYDSLVRKLQKQNYLELLSEEHQEKLVETCSPLGVSDVNEAGDDLPELISSGPMDMSLTICKNKSTTVNDNSSYFVVLLSFSRTSIILFWVITHSYQHTQWVNIDYVTVFIFD